MRVESQRKNKYEEGQKEVGSGTHAWWSRWEGFLEVKRVYLTKEQELLLETWPLCTLATPLIGSSESNCKIAAPKSGEGSGCANFDSALLRAWY